MKRASTDGMNKKNNWDNLVDRKCNRCGNDKAWTSRGKENPQYIYKCTKCGETE